MTYLILVILASTGIIISFKLFPRFGVETDQAIALNYLTASLFSIVTGASKTSLNTIIHTNWFFYSMLVGVVLIIGFYLFATSAQKAGVAITAISSRMSVVIPVSAGFLLFSDVAGPTKIAGIMLALIALYLTSKNESKNKIDKKYIYLPVFVFLAAGLNDTLIKIAQEWFINNDYLEFVGSSFFFAFVVGIIILIYKKKIRTINLNTILGGIIVGLINFCSIYFLIKGLETMQVSTFMPLYNVSVVAFSSLIGYKIFKEKLSATNWAGIAVAILSIFLIAIN